MNPTSQEWRHKRQQAIYFALASHGDQRYDGLPYIVHLMEVEQVIRDHKLHVESFGTDEVPNECTLITLAVWLHDVLEDANVKYSVISDRFSKEVADIVYNVTNELGKTRKEVVDRTYPKIQSCELSTCVKLADRISNVRYGLARALNSKVKKYLYEYENFRNKLFNTEHLLARSLWEELDSLIQEVNLIIHLRTYSGTTK